MKKRGVRSPFLIAFLGSLSLAVFVHAGCPLLPHADPADQREFQNVCQQLSAAPSVSTGTGAPTFRPKKIGDEYIDTTNHKVYFSTATATSGSWLIVN